MHKEDFQVKNITILGSTGSIGTQTLDVIRNQRENFNLVGISANSRVEKVIEIIEEFSPKLAAVTDKVAYEKLKNYADLNGIKTKILYGIDGLNTISTLPEVDTVVTSVVGMVGLVPTMKAIEAGKDIALANKETLVVGGAIVMEAAKKHNVKILPVDSEHGAIFQCLQGNNEKELNKIILTASGGPFRGKKTEDLKNVTAKEALKHPKWNMGQKISIDSATLMNKGLEVIEAHWLFNISYDNIEVVIHPQSIIHSMVEYVDGSIIAQLGVPDMRLPIQYALSYPYRQKKIVDSLNIFEMGNLTFENPDRDTFKCLKLAFEAGRYGRLMPTILNGANEEAVALLLEGRIKFIQIGDIVEECMNKFDAAKDITLHNIIECDNKVKEYIRNKY